MPYILVVMTLVSGGWAVEMQEFSTKDRCSVALGQIESTIRGAGVGSNSFKLGCLPK